MSPPETHREGNLLEHPVEAFNYFRSRGVGKVVCEQKHMGSRAMVIVCKDEETACRRFGVEGEGQGIVYTRTGRRFFNQEDIERALLARVCTGAAIEVLATGAQRLPELEAQLTALKSRRDLIAQYIDAYRRYCWPTHGLEGIKLAPFHLLASEGKVHTDRSHDWHMTALARLAAVDPQLLMATAYRVVDLESSTDVARTVDWWLELTASGGEGMVVKPLEFVARDQRGLLQPAIKCRGREYLRIIYGPEYDLPHNLDRLRQRGLSAKRSLAEREFCLGIEALNRFVSRQPLRQVHECVFGVLALESEPVDPRL